MQASDVGKRTVVRANPNLDKFIEALPFENSRFGPSIVSRSLHAAMVYVKAVPAAERWVASISTSQQVRLKHLSQEEWQSRCA